MPWERRSVAAAAGLQVAWDVCRQMSPLHRFCNCNGPGKNSEGVYAFENDGNLPFCPGAQRISIPIRGAQEDVMTRQSFLEVRDVGIFEDASTDIPVPENHPGLKFVPKTVDHRDIVAAVGSERVEEIVRLSYRRGATRESQRNRSWPRHRSRSARP